MFGVPLGADDTTQMKHGLCSHRTPTPRDDREDGEANSYHPEQEAQEVKDDNWGTFGKSRLSVQGSLRALASKGQGEDMRRDSGGEGAEHGEGRESWATEVQ